MDVFDPLPLMGGLCLFLRGMNVMGERTEHRTGNGLKALLGRLTNSKIKGFLAGLGVTTVIQSFFATTAMVVGFVNSKGMTLKQSVGVIDAAAQTMDAHAALRTIKQEDPYYAEKGREYSEKYSVSGS
ncbi:MAG: hypothetical protein E7643_04165 [Ruminococcaceae bacterium]|nr:hypothetical protein [Oscillospiraceae bacterium]